MRVFISGGCRNGKSLYAQTLAKQMRSHGKPLYYLATMIPMDDEDRQRIEKHHREREGWGFETVEIPRNIVTVLQRCDPGGSFLLDSVTALVANEMFGAEGVFIPSAVQKTIDELTLLVKKIKHMVFVSDDVHSDACLYDTVTEAYRQGLALIGRKLASVCDSVLEMSAGNVIVHQHPEKPPCSKRY